MNTKRAQIGDKVSGNYHGHEFTGQIVGGSEEWIEIELVTPVAGNCAIAMHRAHDSSKITVVERYVGELEYTGGGVRIARTVEQLRARFATVRAWTKLSASEFETLCVKVNYTTRPTLPILWLRAAHKACETTL